MVVEGTTVLLQLLLVKLIILSVDNWGKVLVEVLLKAILQFHKLLSILRLCHNSATFFWRSYTYARM